MIKNRLILLSRVGCCLCKGLEDLLANSSLEALDPPLKLVVVDIDGKDVPASLKERYNLEVPVLFLELNQFSQRYELPRVSPRLSEDNLLKWLAKMINEKMTKQ